MSEKSIGRRVRCPLAAARPARADDPDRFGIATSPECVRDQSTRSVRDRPSRRNRDCADECCRSGPSSASGSRKTVTASSNETPCFAALASAFRGSHSNTHLVYTKCPDPPPASPITHTRAHRAVRRNVDCFCQNCVTCPSKPWGTKVILRGHAEADRCCGESLSGSALWVSMCVSMRQRSQFPSVLLHPPSLVERSILVLCTVADS